MDAATDTPGCLQLHPARSDAGHQVVKDHVGDIFVEDAASAIALQVQLERFQLDTTGVGDITDDHRAEVWLARLGAGAGELMHVVLDDVIPLGVRVRERL